MDAESVGPHQRLAGDLHHDAPVDGFCHGSSCDLPPAQAARPGERMGGNTLKNAQVDLTRAATSPPKSLSGRSMPSPRA
jgi:hypothetical protein